MCAKGSGPVASGMLRWALLLGLLGPAHPARILVALPFSVYSHTMPFLPVFRTLAERGHHVTFISNFTLGPPSENYTHIDYKYNTAILNGQFRDAVGQDVDFVALNGFFYHASGLWTICPFASKILLDNIRPVLPPPTDKFDLIVIEPFFCQEFLLGLSQYYNAPLVGILPGPITPYITHAMGNPLLFPYVPNLRLPLTDHMNLFERVWNTVIGLIELIGAYVIHLPSQNGFMLELLEGSRDVPYITNFYKNISLLLIEAHFSVNYPRPYLRNIVEIGGVEIKSDKKMPKKLDDFMNEATNGVIYFSWGSHYVDLNPNEKLEALMEIFSKLKESVIFKWSDVSQVRNVPKNVLVLSWVPQLSVLAHKNTKLFISHCGLNSVYEAIYFGIPVIGTPLFGDQPHNSRLLESFGMGITINTNGITDKVTLLKGINKILSDHSFKKNAEERSRIIRDRPLPSHDEAAYWIEYVMKHSKGNHLKPASLDLPWYSLFLIDVWLSLLIVTLVPLLVCIKTFSFFYKNKTYSNVNLIKKKNN